MSAVWTVLIGGAYWLADRTTTTITAYRTAKRRDEIKAAAARGEAK